MFFIAIFIIIAAIGCWLADVTKGRGIDGLILCLCFGIIGLIIIFFIKDKRPRCTHCGDIFDLNYISCKSCGKTIYDEKMKFEVIK